MSGMTKEDAWALAEYLGFTPSDVAAIHLLPNHIEVETLLRNEEGKRYDVVDPATHERDIARETHLRGYEPSVEEA